MKFRSNSARGHIAHSRLGDSNFESYRSFSFEGYQDPRYDCWGPVRTVNDDRADPGFITSNHLHVGLDILSYVVRGQVHHKDNLGNELSAQEGQVQWMSCGSGIWHTEGNTSDKPNRYLQIWIQPNKIAPVWEPSYQLITREPGFALLPLQLQNTELSIRAGLLTGSHQVTGPSYLLQLEGTSQCLDYALSEGDSLEIDRPCDIESQGGHLLLFTLTY